MTAGDWPFEIADSSQRLPDRDLSAALVNFYFDVCVVTYRIFHRNTVLGWLNTMHASSQNNLPITNNLGYAKPAVVLTILAIATLRQEKIQGSKSTDIDEAALLKPSDCWFSVANRLIQEETGLPNLESAQAR